MVHFPCGDFTSTVIYCMVFTWTMHKMLDYLCSFKLKQKCFKENKWLNSSSLQDYNKVTWPAAECTTRNKKYLALQLKR